MIRIEKYVLDRVLFTFLYCPAKIKHPRIVSNVAWVKKKYLTKFLITVPKKKTFKKRKYTLATQDYKHEESTLVGAYI